MSDDGKARPKLHVTKWLSSTPAIAVCSSCAQANFSYQASFGSKVPVAYETLLLDAMRGDATLFTRRDEVEAE
jgi:glucose-6-phosphate 1-dehydrogenase